MRRSVFALAFLLVAPLSALAITALMRRHSQHAARAKKAPAREEEEATAETAPAPVGKSPAQTQGTDGSTGEEEHKANEEALALVGEESAEGEKATDEHEDTDEEEDVDAEAPQRESAPVQDKVPIELYGDFTTLVEDLALDGIAQDEASDEDAEFSGTQKREIPFTWKSFEQRLLMSIRPLDVLSDEVERIKDRMHERRATDVERYIERMVRESAILEVTDELPALNLVVLNRNSLIYVRGTSRASYKAHLAVLSFEAGLNTLVFASEKYDDLESVDEERICRLAQRVMHSVLALSPAVDNADWSYLAMPWQTNFGPTQAGEWATRNAFFDLVESLRLPYRLTLHCRANVDAGDFAIEFDATRWQILPLSAYVAEIGLVATTPIMRKREAAAYNARVALLLVACAFSSNIRIRRVWIQATTNDPKHHACLLSAAIDRRDFTSAHIGISTDAIEALAAFGASMMVEDGALLPTEELFHLSDATFCPPERNDILRLEDHPLPATCVHALGATHLLDLSIHEDLPRTIALEEVMRLTVGTEVGESAQASVRAILDVAGSTSNLTVWEATQRVCRRIIEGTLTATDGQALSEEMMAGDDLSQAMLKAKHLAEEAHNPEAAIRCLEDTLASIDGEGRYDDTSGLVFRSFASFTERVIFNRTSEDTRTVALAPDNYVIAHLSAASLLLYQAQKSGPDAVRRAIAHAEAARVVAPLSAPACLLECEAYIMLGETDEAEALLRGFLEFADSPQPIAIAYLRLAEINANNGDFRTAKACYRMCVRIMPQITPLVIAELASMTDYSINFDGLMDLSECHEILAAASIPEAPTLRTSYILLDGASAAVDANIFPVARDLLMHIEMFTADDVMHAIRSSLESMPDE